MHFRLPEMNLDILLKANHRSKSNHLLFNCRIILMQEWECGPKKGQTWLHISFAPVHKGRKYSAYQGGWLLQFPTRSSTMDKRAVSCLSKGGWNMTVPWNFLSSGTVFQFPYTRPKVQWQIWRVTNYLPA